MTRDTQKKIEVCVHSEEMDQPMLMGTLSASITRGKEIFSFEYAPEALKAEWVTKLDPNLMLVSGPQYNSDERPNFGLFLDSSPDRWGRVLMQRREARLAREASRAPRLLMESDYLLGVYDGHRMGALRFRRSSDGPFLDDNTSLASPPWARLRDLEYASLQLESDGAEDNRDYMQWLNLLIAPGGSLGGARPKASVIDEAGDLWIAKFPSLADEINTGAWEFIVYQLAEKSGVHVTEAKHKKFSGKYDTFLTKRFDRTGIDKRIHFASAMTLLGKKDGDGANTEVSYLDIAEIIIRGGAQPEKDLEQLWRRIVFNICVSNTDDHLRNHGLLLASAGWLLSPAYDVNPSPSGDGLTLNISKTDNAQDLELALSVASYFRVKAEHAKEIITEVKRSVRSWETLAKDIGLPTREIELVRRAFRIAESV